MKLKNACFALSLLFWAAMSYAQVTGSGTTDYIPLWTGVKTIGDSAIYQSAERIGIGTKAPGAKLNVVTTSTSAPAITGSANATSGTAPGVYGTTASSTTYAAAVYGHSTATTGTATFGVYGQSDSPNGIAIQGYASSSSAGIGEGVAGFTNNSGTGVLGGANATTGINFGVQGISFSSGGYGVTGTSPFVAVAGSNQVCSSSGCTLTTGTAGQFATGSGGVILQGLGPGYVQVFSVDSSGNVSIAGNLSKGSGSFKIDHPLDPANKYLEHSFVESPDMMNIYNGVIVLDSKGEAYVTLPDYFQALNSDFRYQLTAMGAPGPNLYVAEEISGNHFKVSGGKPGGKVSWQVTGVRQDAYAKAHRIRVEEDKPAREKGHYLHPELFGATEKESVGAVTPPATTSAAAVAEVIQANLR
jgi:hypothetical protein